MIDGGDEYDTAWNELRRRRRNLMRPAMVYLGTCVVAAVSALFGLPRWAGIFLIPPLVISLALIVIAGVRLAAWRCPRCGRYFHRGFATGDRCRGCGLYEFESKEWQRIDMRQRSAR